jgi:hypothetical protein
LLTDLNHRRPGVNGDCPTQTANMRPSGLLLYVAATTTTTPIKGIGGEWRQDARLPSLAGRSVMLRLYCVISFFMYPLENRPQEPSFSPNKDLRYGASAGCASPMRWRSCVAQQRPLPPTSQPHNKPPQRQLTLATKSCTGKTRPYHKPNSRFSVRPC